MSDKNKRKLENDSDEQVLSYYIDNRIKLMQEVLSLIKPKKIMTMAPDFMKDMQVSVVKSLLLEELLGISNKRLRSILAGENVNTDSSSSESEIETKKSSDTISLQEISDDSDCCIDIELSEKERLELEKDNAKLLSNNRVKSEPKKGEKKNDTGKQKRRKSTSKKTIKSDEPVVNVLNLLELQARARAIRSQLANELLHDKNTDTVSKTVTNDVKVENETKEQTSDDEHSSGSVILISPDNLSVISVGSHSDSETLGRNEDFTNDANEKSVPLELENSGSKSPPSKSSEQNTEHQRKDESDTEPWKTRWLESKKVQDVMKTTKLYNSLRQSRKQKSVSSEEGNVDINVPETNNETTEHEPDKENSLDEEKQSDNLV